MLYWNWTLGRIVYGLLIVRSVHMGNLECCMVLILVHISTNEINKPVEYICRGHRRVSTSSHWHNGSDWKFYEYRDNATRDLHILMVIPALLWHSI
jgi:hypothetical protein